MRGAQYTMQVRIYFFYFFIFFVHIWNQVDVYSFGVLLWEAFAGESAHDGLVLRDLHGCPYLISSIFNVLYYF